MSDVETVEKTTVKLKKPSRWAVVLHNDDVTPMDFVVELLNFIFKMSIEQSTELMITVHTKGKGIAGIYPFEVAEQKLAEANTYILVSGHNLKLSLEEQ